MTIIRRTYAYLLAFAGLSMLALAVANLAQLLIDVLLQAPLASTDRYVRDTVSFSGASALVGLPAWLFHWLWIERTTRSEPDERRSSLRGLYLYALLAGATLVTAAAVHAVLGAAFEALLGSQPAGAAPVLDQVVRPLPFALIGVAVWLAHWRIAAADRGLVGESGGTATLRRWYLYGAALIGLLLLLSGARELLKGVWDTLASTDGAAGALIADAVTTTLVGLGLWLVHWVYVPGRMVHIDRRTEESAVLRSVYLFVTLAVGVIGTLVGASQLLYYAAGRLLGVESPGGVGGNLLQAAAGPTSIALVYGAAWAYQRVALGRQAAAVDETPRQAGIRRLYTYLISLVALGALAYGVAGLLWTLCDVLFSPGASSGDYWRERVAIFATLSIVGLPVWVLHWRPRPPTAADAHSLARRLYVYLSLIAAMLTLIASVAGALYRLIGLALGEPFTTDVASDLAHAIAVACIAAVLAAYHWRVLRADALQAQPAPPPPPLLAPVDALGLERLVVEIHAADAASLSRALSALRSTGVQVTVLQPQPPS